MSRKKRTTAKKKPAAKKSAAKKTVKKTAKKKPAAKKSAAKKTVKKTAKKADKPAKVKKSTAKTSKNTDMVAKNAPVKKTDKTRSFSLLRGMKDVYPPSSRHWAKARQAAEAVVDAYGFKNIETPILEHVSLFIRSIGKGTDVVDKEMYMFEDRDGSKICLRPEATASIARAYINHGLHTLPQPVKVWYWGSMFRHNRPQAGRYREFHQFGCETIGERDPVVDAELIAVAYNFLRDLGIESVVSINSIGTLEEREQYIIELVGYLRSKRSYLSDESKKRINKNPLRILDSKDENDKIVVEEAPQILDWLSDKSKKFFMSVLEYLDEAEVPYVLTPTLVRGLDYYSDTVFELNEEDVEETSQSAWGGGGRYDGLVEQLGGPETPGCGFSMGIERIVSVMQRKAKEERERGEIKKKEGNSVFLAQLGEQARRRALYLVEDLRRSGILVHHNFAKAALKNQLEIADRLKVSHTLILGQKEVQDETILLRNMDSGIQEVIDQKKLKTMLNKLITV